MAERRRQWEIEKQVQELESKISFRLSDNTAAIGSLLKSSYKLKRSDDEVVY